MQSVYDQIVLLSDGLFNPQTMFKDGLFDQVVVQI